MDEINYEAVLREYITELRIKKNVSEHRMSLDLGKSGSYIKSEFENYDFISGYCHS